MAKLMDKKIFTIFLPFFLDLSYIIRHLLQEEKEAELAVLGD